MSNEHGSCMEQMNTIFRIVSICLGTPPKTFTWEYTDKSKKYHKVADISPLEFYNQHVRSVVSRIKSVISELHLKASVCISLSNNRMVADRIGRGASEGGTGPWGQYKTPGMPLSIRAQRGRARSALFCRVNSKSWCTLIALLEVSL